ncbi:MAG: hypothetical protein J0M29_07260 [Chitinophagales bacterium]|nr:hypothetical protein [Chitinophagales bacterium]
MKKQFNFILIAMLFAFVANAVNIAPEKASNIAPQGIVVTDGVVYATADHYNDAQSVTVQLISENGRVQATATTAPGQTVQLTLADNSQKVKFSYRYDCCTIIIDQDLPPNI